MKKKFLAGVCLVAGALGLVAPVLAQEAYCEKWCVTNGKSRCCAKGLTSGRWYESDEQRCQTILQQQNFDQDSELMGQFEHCQKVQKEADAKKAEREKALQEHRGATPQAAQPVQSKPSLSNLPPVNANFTNLQNFGAQPGEMPSQPLATE